MQDQYIFVHDAVYEALQTENTSVQAANFNATYNMLCKVSAKTGETPLTSQFQVGPPYSIAWYLSNSHCRFTNI